MNSWRNAFGSLQQNFRLIPSLLQDDKVLCTGNRCLSVVQILSQMIRILILRSVLRKCCMRVRTERIDVLFGNGDEVLDSKNLEFF